MLPVLFRMHRKNWVAKNQIINHTRLWAFDFLLAEMKKLTMVAETIVRTGLSCTTIQANRQSLPLIANWACAIRGFVLLHFDRV